MSVKNTPGTLREQNTLGTTGGWHLFILAPEN